jgi:hypothetical protein
VRATRHLAGVGSVVTVVSRDPRRSTMVAASVGGSAAEWTTPVTEPEDLADVVARWRGPSPTVVIATAGSHLSWARAALAGGADVVSTASDPADCSSLTDLDTEARSRSRTVVVGAGMAPGFACLLAAWVASRSDEVGAVRVTTHGSGGPACADAARGELRGRTHEYRHGWTTKPAGRSRRLVWFPAPIGVQRSAAAASSLPMLLAPVVHAGIIEASRTVPLRRLHRSSEETLGGLVVEVEGRSESGATTTVLGTVDRPAAIAGAVAAAVAWNLARADAEGVEVRWPLGAHGVAAGSDPGALLAALARRGVRAAEFIGA